MSNQKSSSPALVLLAWLFVAIPLGWGIYNTVRNSMKLFQTPPAHATWVSRPAPHGSEAELQPPRRFTGMVDQDPKPATSHNPARSLC